MKTTLVMLALIATVQAQGKTLPNPVVWADLSEKLLTEIRAIVHGPVNAPLPKPSSAALELKRERLDPLRFLQPSEKKKPTVGKLRMEGFYIVTE